MRFETSKSLDTMHAFKLSYCVELVRAIILLTAEIAALTMYVVFFFDRLSLFSSKIDRFRSLIFFLFHEMDNNVMTSCRDTFIRITITHQRCSCLSFSVFGKKKD